MSTTVLLLSLVALFVFYLYKKKGSSTSDFKELAMSPAERIIRVYDMDKEQLKNAVDSFSDISDDEISAITPEGDNQCATGSTTLYTPMRKRRYATKSAAGIPSAKWKSTARNNPSATKP